MPTELHHSSRCSRAGAALAIGAAQQESVPLKSVRPDGPGRFRLTRLGHFAAIIPYRIAVGNEVDLRYHLGNDIKIWDMCVFRSSRPRAPGMSSSDSDPAGKVVGMGRITQDMC